MAEAEGEQYWEDLETSTVAREGGRSLPFTQMSLSQVAFLDNEAAQHMAAKQTAASEKRRKPDSPTIDEFAGNEAAQDDRLKVEAAASIPFLPPQLKLPNRVTADMKKFIKSLAATRSAILETKTLLKKYGEHRQQRLLPEDIKFSLPTANIYPAVMIDRKSAIDQLEQSLLPVKMTLLDTIIQLKEKTLETLTRQLESLTVENFVVQLQKFIKEDSDYARAILQKAKHELAQKINAMDIESTIAEIRRNEEQEKKMATATAMDQEQTAITQETFQKAMQDMRSQLLRELSAKNGRAPSGQRSTTPNRRGRPQERQQQSGRSQNRSLSHHSNPRRSTSRPRRARESASPSPRHRTITSGSENSGGNNAGRREHVGRGAGGRGRERGGRQTNRSGGRGRRGRGRGRGRENQN